MTDLGGRNYKGEPRLRTVWGGEERRWDGKFKYYDPFDARKPMECWIVEVWMPPKFFGDPADWNTAMCGPFPSEGVYGIKTPLMDYNGPLPLTEETFNCIKRKQLLDVEWSEQDAKALAPLGMTTHVTGTTTITSITATNFKTGDVLTLIFDSTAQISDGNNLVLNGNFTGGANRVLTLKYDGTNFVEQSRSAN